MHLLFAIAIIYIIVKLCSNDNPAPATCNCNKCPHCGK